jgi:hypothetical protein
MTEYADGIHPGKDLGTRELVVSEAWIEKYMGSIADRNPWYTHDSPFGGPIAPAAVFNYELQLCGGWHPPGIEGEILNTGTRWEFHRALRPGQKLTVRSRVHDRYVKRGREHIAMEASAYDEEGNLVCRCITTDAWKAR